MNLAELLDQQAAQRPEQTALIDGRCESEREISYGRLQELTLATAAHLKQVGITSGSRVLVLVPMRSELYVTLAALWRLGAVALFLDPSAGREHIAQCCAQAKPDALIGVPKARWLSLICPALRRVTCKLYWGSQLRWGVQPSGSIPIVEVPADQPAILTFTSGSTGEPKGAIRTHAVLRAQYKALTHAIALEPGERDLATMPIIALVNLAAGLTTLIPDADLRRPGFIKPGPVLKQIKRFQPTRCEASPAFLRVLCEEAERRGEPLSGFSKIYTGGAPVFPRNLRLYARSFVNASVNVLFGSTEAEPISHISLDEIAEADLAQMRAGNGLLVGAVSPETRLRIIRDQWGESLGLLSTDAWADMALPVGEIGEIVVSGDHVVPGYLNGQGDAENKIRVDGTIWHRTGDAGYLDSEGRLWLMGRCSAKFEVDGQTIYPFSVECAAAEHFNVPIAGCLKQDTGYILAIPTLSNTAIDDHFAPQLPRPENILQLKHIPVDKRHNAKIDYKALEKII